LVQRLYVPESGRVLIDGVDVAQADPSWLRRQIGVVLQDNVLFNCSVRDNIALADPSASTERIVAAATLAGAHEFILTLPEGYDTLVGERGGGLSGGQRQRVAIARALLADPRILIFDEATSALDYESERIIQENMSKICRGRTVFIIAHRLSALRNADRIITIEHGRIVEEGTHQGLLDRGGRYAELHQLQGGGDDRKHSPHTIRTKADNRPASLRPRGVAGTVETLVHASLAHKRGQNFASLDVGHPRRQGHEAATCH
jgi:subfamily B ATP-binding cassette protein HlyB/CyaB